MKTKEYVKTASFVVVLALIVVFANQIQEHLVSSYNHYVESLASRTIASSNIIGF